MVGKGLKVHVVLVGLTNNFTSNDRGGGPKDYVIQTLLQVLERKGL